MMMAITFVLLLHFIIAQLSQMHPHHKDPRLSSIKLDLQIIRCQTSEYLPEVLPRTCKNNEELLKVLTMKNNQPYFKELKQANSKRRDGESNEAIEELIWTSFRVRQQKQKAMSELQKRDKGKQKSRQTSTLNMLKSFDSSRQHDRSKISIFEYLSILGGQQQIRACKKFRINNQNNKQDVEELAQCFRHIVSVSQEIKLEQIRQKSIYTIQSIEQFKYLFQQICEVRSKSQNKSLNLINFINNAKKDRKLQKLFKNRHFFETSLALLESHTYQSQLNPQKLIFNQHKRLFSNIDLFINSEQKQQKFMKEALNQSQFWQKVCYLYSKGPQFHSLLIHHLKYKQEEYLINHLNKVIQGLESTFQPNQSLFEQNSYYRQFVLLLDGKYLKYCIQNENKPQKDLIYYALRQSELLFHKNKQFSFQKTFLKTASAKLIYKFKTSLLLQQNNQVIYNQMAELFALGQFSSCFTLLCQNGKISTIQYALLLCIVNQIDVKYSTILFYDHLQALTSYKTLIKNIIKIPKNYQIQAYFWIMVVLLSSFSTQDDNNKSFIINIITENVSLFEFLCESIGFQPFINKFQLNLKQIKTILQAAINKHRNYAYCFQLALSSCIFLQQFPKMKHKDSNGKRKPIQKSQQTSMSFYNVGNKLESFKNLQLNIMEGASKQFIDNQKLRFQILTWGFETLINIQLKLLKDVQLRQQKFEEIVFIKDIYKQLNSEVSKKYMFSCLSLKNIEKTKEINEKLSKYTSMLVLTFNMLRIKNSIKNRQFECIVHVLNSIIEQMSQSFKQTYANLQKLIQNPQKTRSDMFNFISDIIQAILFMKQCQKRVIQRNRTIFHCVCKQVYAFLSQIKGRQPDSKHLFQQLQRIMRELNYF